jgi:hypothetical protein
VNLDEVEADWTAGHILTGELASLARTLVEGGHDVPALRQLLAMPFEEGRGEARRTFERALRELGRGGMSRSEAAMVLARRWSRELLARKLSARRATKAIAHVRFRGSADVDDALRPFSELYALYEDADERALARLRTLGLNRRARAEARRLLARFSGDERP